MVVNGFIANVYGNEFVVNHVPLADGSNTITATATDTSGNTQSASITVSAVTTGDYIRITAIPESGISPLQTTLKINSSLNISTATLSCPGPGTVEFLLPDANGTRATMDTKGIYYCTASVNDSGGGTYDDTVAITALDKTEMDNLLRAKWDGMKMALASGDINGAARYFYSTVEGIYRDQFTGLSSFLPAIASEMDSAEINLVTITDSIAEYELLVEREGEALSFYFKFNKDDDGIWRIGGF